MSASRTIGSRKLREAPDPARQREKSSIDRIVETAIYLQTEGRRLAKEQCARHGITATQLNVLKLLQTVGELSLSELSKQMAATNSTVTGIIDRMVAAGLVAREQSTEDRRVWRIRLLPEGRALAKKVDVAPWEILKAAVVALEPAELEQLIKTLVKVADHVEQTVAAGEARLEKMGKSA
ncbi:MAG TPA: MarR family transcriptional regulator [Kofleriaceae bacterium]|nr:MarR family transcriptional regulator [Kofleriaceae bacterium]